MLRRFVVVALWLLTACGQKEALPRFGEVPVFTLQDHASHPFSAQSLKGKVWVVDFIFTSCPDVCPLLTEQLAGVRKQLPQDAALGFASFSVDPEHDTPEKLRAFAAQHGALQPNWFFVTGPIDEIKRVVTQGFKQAIDPRPAQGGKPANVLHGTHFVLVDRRGTIRGFYRSDPEGIAELTPAVKALLAEGDAP